MFDRLRQLTTAAAETVETLRCLPGLVDQINAVATGAGSTVMLFEVLNRELEIARDRAGRLDRHNDALLDKHDELDALNAGLATELDEVKAERDSLRDALAKSESHVLAFSADRDQWKLEHDALRDQLEWLKRWRKQSVEPCPFPRGTMVEYRKETWRAGEFSACALTSFDNETLWRPTVECLEYYTREEKANG